MRREAQDVAIIYLEEIDAVPLFENYFGDEKTCLYLNRQAHQSPNQTLQAISRWRAQYELDHPNIFVLAIEESATHVPIGCLVLIPEKSRSEIHFGISRNYQGKGYTTQACKLGIEHLKSIGVEEIYTTPHIDHQASIRVLEKCGFKKQGVLKEYTVFPALSMFPQDCLSMRFKRG